MTLPKCEEPGCEETSDLAICNQCGCIICRKHRFGSGDLSDGYACSMACTVARAFPAPPALPGDKGREHVRKFLYCAVVAIGIFLLYYLASSCVVRKEVRPPSNPHSQALHAYWPNVPS